MLELWKTDHGIDGRDAVTTLVAKFTHRTKAVSYLTAIGHTHFETGWYWHRDRDKRWTMGAISYDIRDGKPDTPIDPEPPSFLRSPAIIDVKDQPWTCSKCRCNVYCHNCAPPDL